MRKTISLSIAAAIAAASIAACEQQGAFEEAGEDIDEAVEDLDDGLNQSPN